MSRQSWVHLASATLQFSMEANVWQKLPFLVVGIFGFRTKPES